MQFPPQNRLLSVDAYRGFVMLAMVSSGFAIADTVDACPELLKGDRAGWWSTLAYQFEHVAWAGCAFWDLIQPSFMFLVGVSLPFSFQKRLDQEHSRFGMFIHALVRSLILVGLGIVLYSQSSGFINFKLVNVLTQIGLGYMFVYVLVTCRLRTHLLAIVLILGGYWAFFFFHSPTDRAKHQLSRYLSMTEDQRAVDDSDKLLNADALAEADAKLELADDIQQYEDEIRSHWNKHTNAGAAFDRSLLNLFPRNEIPWRGVGFWVNDGGYLTLNFIPSIATMIFGLIAGLILISDYEPRGKLFRLIGFSLACFLIALSMDTELWPFRIPNVPDWSVCPIVKRIWTPSWTIFSAGWTFAILAAFYLVVDVWNFKLWTFPLAVVGMNSIAIYCLYQLTRDWFLKMLGNLLRTVDAMAGTTMSATLFGEQQPFAAIYQSIAVVAMLWLVCFWLYRRRIFIRV